MNKKVTIIVPVYNAGENINHCIDSIKNQTCKDFEVLLINDGSSDESLKKIIQFSEEFPEVFRVITQENRGVFATRHRGMQEATTFT